MRKQPFLRLTAMLMAVCLLAVLLPPQRAEAAISSNPSISYRVEGDTLIYSGTGYVYSADLAPEDVRNQVKHVIVEAGITSLPAFFMHDSKNLETATLPEGLNSLQMGSFEGCENLRSVNIPSTVTSIGSDVFRNCKSLVSVQLPANLKTIGMYAFEFCTSLTGIKLPAGLENIKASAFNGCAGITELELPQGLQGFSLSGCTGLKRITVPGSVVTLSGLSDCTALEEVVISRGVRTINAAFYRDSALKRVDIPDTVTAINSDAFGYCTSLEEITLPASLTSLDQQAFLNCSNLKKIIFRGTQEQWDAFGPLFITKGNVWWRPDTYFNGEVVCLGQDAVVATVTLTFNANGGTVSPAQKTVAYGERYGELPTPVNGSKTFYGWYTRPEGGSIVSSSDIMNSMEGRTLYAHWSLDTSALTPARAGETFLPAREPFNPSSSLYRTSGILDPSNVNREGGSYLFANEKGGLTRVQLHTGYVNGSTVRDYLVITEMDSNFNITAQGTVPTELESFLGFYPGELYNFLLFCQSNPPGGEEVLRVVKYDKNWNRLGTGSELVGTTIAFGNGTDADYIECAEYNGYLYIHAGRAMNVGHQACTTLVFREGDMTETDVAVLFDDDYVSHAYDQQILVDREGRLVSLDLGDAFPRAMVMFQYKGVAHGTLPGVNTYTVQEIAGTYEKNMTTTGCTVAGMVEAGDYYLVVYQYDPALSSSGGTNGDLLYQFVDKETLTGTSVKLADAKVNWVKVAAVDDSSGYIIWTDSRNYTKIYYAAYGNGTVGAVRQAEGLRAGSTPIAYQGKLVWYVDIVVRQTGKPRSGQYYKSFYTLDPGTGAVTCKDFMMVDTQAVSSGFTDVPANEWYAAAVNWAVEKEITVGTSDTTFSPEETCTHIQILTFLWRAAGRLGSNVYAPVAVDPDVADYRGAVNWAYEKGMIDDRFNPDAPCTSADAVKYIWQAFGSKAAASDGRFTDVSPNAGYRTAVYWAAANGITAGDDSPTLFCPDKTCTRGHIVTFLHRAYVSEVRVNS